MRGNLIRIYILFRRAARTVSRCLLSTLICSTICTIFQTILTIVFTQKYSRCDLITKVYLFSSLSECAYFILHYRKYFVSCERYVHFLFNPRHAIYSAKRETYVEFVYFFQTPIGLGSWNSSKLELGVGGRGGWFLSSLSIDLICRW